MESPRKPEVLVVEDNRLVAEMIALSLRDRDFIVGAVAGDGAEALAAARAQPFDVAVVDLELPDMSGLELLRALRRHLPKTRLVACSAHGPNSPEMTLARAFADAVVTKGITAPSALGDACRGVPRSA